MRHRLAALLVLLTLLIISVTAHAAQIPSEPDGLKSMTTKKQLR